MQQTLSKLPLLEVKGCRLWQSVQVVQLSPAAETKRSTDTAFRFFSATEQEARQRRVDVLDAGYKSLSENVLIGNSRRDKRQDMSWLSDMKSKTRQNFR